MAAAAADAAATVCDVYAVYWPVWLVVVFMPPIFDRFVNAFFIISTEQLNKTAAEYCARGFCLCIIYGLCFHFFQ